MVTANDKNISSGSRQALIATEGFTNRQSRPNLMIASALSAAKIYLSNFFLAKRVANSRSVSSLIAMIPYVKPLWNANALVVPSLS